MCTMRLAGGPYCSHLSGLLLAWSHISSGPVSLNIPGPLVPRKSRRSTWKSLSRQKCQPDRGKGQRINKTMNDDSLTTRAHDFVLAIDFGGTKVAIATAATTGSILQQARLDTHASQGAQQLLEKTTATAHA